MLKIALLVLFSLIYLSPESSVFAHGIGQTYTLPVPLWLYLYSSAAVVAVSFLVVGLIVKSQPQNIEKSTTITINPTFSFVKSAIKLVSVFLFLLFIVTGLFGNQDAQNNFAPTFLWANFIIAITIGSAVFGNFWEYLNPLKIIFEVLEKKLALKGQIAYPTILARWPAAVFYLIFIWLELATPLSSSPRFITILGTFYALISLWAMAIFGKNVWLTNGEFTSVIFGLFAKISPLKLESGKVIVRIPFSGLLEQIGSNFSIIFVVILTLSGTAFDGIRESVFFFNILKLSNLTNLDPPTYRTLGVLATPIPFLFIYLFFIKIAQIITTGKKSYLTLASYLSFSILPISLGYFIAHFWVLFVTSGQETIRLISDPFGYRWNLFTTADYKTKFFLRADFVWYSQITAIVLGHVIAVVVAHFIALKFYKDPKKALLSQIPIAILMVGFTVFSLWLLSQPIAVSPK